jgi:hypothetical protein
MTARPRGVSGSASRAGAITATAVSRLSPQIPTTDPNCSMTGAMSHTEPSGFHGNPVRTHDFSHSATVQAEASSRTRPRPPTRLECTARVARPTKAASRPDNPKMAKGIIQPKRAGSVSRALLIQ